MSRKMRRMKGAKAAAKKVPLWRDMLFADFAHRFALERINFSGYTLTDDLLRRCLSVEAVRLRMRCVAACVAVCPACLCCYPACLCCCPACLCRYPACLSVAAAVHHTRGAAVVARELVLRKCVLITAEGFVAVLRCQSLTSLDVSNCVLLEEAVFDAVPKHLRRLQDLNLSGCKNTTSITLISIVTTCVRCVPSDSRRARVVCRVDASAARVQVARAHVAGCAQLRCGDKHRVQQAAVAPEALLADGVAGHRRLPERRQRRCLCHRTVVQEAGVVVAERLYHHGRRGDDGFLPD